MSKAFILFKFQIQKIAANNSIQSKTGRTSNGNKIATLGYAQRNEMTNLMSGRSESAICAILLPNRRRSSFFVPKNAKQKAQSTTLSY